MYDLGFRPYNDGYWFANFGVGPERTVKSVALTMDDFRDVYGNSAVCNVGVDGVLCLWEKPQARGWLNGMNAIVGTGGLCSGFASSSLSFFDEDYEAPSDIIAGRETTYELPSAQTERTMLRHIVKHHIRQFSTPILSQQKGTEQKQPSEILAELQTAMTGDDPVTLFIRYQIEDEEGELKEVGHAIVPYAITTDSTDSSRHHVWIYDNNAPYADTTTDDSLRHIVIDTANEQWSYGSKSGGKGTIGIIPISLFNQQPECPWCNQPTLANEIATGQVWFNGTGDFLLTNGQGQRLGYVGNELVNEIPGAAANIIDGGLDIPIEPYYTIPFSDSYKIFLTGESSTDSEPASISQYGPGYATSIDNIPMTENSNDQITIASDGTQISYLSNEAKEVNMEVIVEETDADQDWHLQVQGTDIGSGQMVTATADQDQDKLIIDNSRTSGGEYDIQIVRFNATGVQTFTATAITIAGGDTHAIDYGSWDDSTNTMPLEIDEQSDGSIDQTVTLGKQQVYLPLVVR
jgi:hypothetical protein